MKGKSQTQGKAFGYVIAVPVAALIAVAVMSIYEQLKTAQSKRANRIVKTETYLAEQPGPFCVLEGVWHNWEEDETISLGCLVLKGIVRTGSYSSATGPRATANLSISGTYDLDADDSILVVGISREGKQVKFSKTIHVDDTEYPTQMILIDKAGEKGVYIWKSKD